jgi:hypothetical protein
MTSLQIPKAEVYDIRSIGTLPKFRYYLDTNILKFVFARTFIKEQSYQVTYYPTFFKRLLSNKNIMKFTFTQNLIELFSTLDYIEQEYLNSSIKKYRQKNLEIYLDSRKNIFEEIEKSLQVLSIQITPANLNTYFDIDFSIDLKDFIYSLHAKEQNTAFVTDDYEFIFIDGIRVFTANPNTIHAASRFKKLVS